MSDKPKQYHIDLPAWLGVVLTLVAMLLAGAVSYGGTSAKTETTDKAIQQLQQQVTNLETKVNAAAADIAYIKGAIKGAR